MQVGAKVKVSRYVELRDSYSLAQAIAFNATITTKGLFKSHTSDTPGILDSINEQDDICEITFGDHTVKLPSVILAVIDDQ